MADLPGDLQIPPDLRDPSIARILALMGVGGLAGAPGGIPGMVIGAGAGGLSAPYIHRLLRQREQMMDAQNQPGGFYGEDRRRMLARELMRK